MKVKELIEQLQKFDGDMEIRTISINSNPLDGCVGWECLNTFMITNGATGKAFVYIIPTM